METTLTLVPDVGVRLGNRTLRFGAVRREVWHVLGEPEHAPTAFDTETFGPMRLAYDDDDRLRTISVVALPGIRCAIELSGAVIEPFASAERTLGQLRHRGAVQTIEDPHSGTSYSMPSMDLGLWQSNDDEERFQAAAVSAPGATSMQERVLVALRGARWPARGENEPTGFGLIWPDDLDRSAFQRFAVELRDRPLPGLELSLIGRRCQGWIPALEGISSIRGLSLSLVDEERFPALPAIRSLELGFASAPWQEIGRLTTLRRLKVQGTDLTDDDLFAFGGLTELRALAVSGRGITGASAAFFQNVPNLEFVSLYQTSADDRTCEALAKLTELRTVVLRGTKVTESGARLLASSPTIHFLNVAATEVPEALVAELAAIGRRRGKLAFGAGSL